MGIALGCHVDGRVLLLDHVQTEQRRRCWAGILMLHTIQATSFGNVDILRLSNHDVAYLQMLTMSMSCRVKSNRLRVRLPRCRTCFSSSGSIACQPVSASSFMGRVSRTAAPLLHWTARLLTSSKSGTNDIYSTAARPSYNTTTKHTGTSCIVMRISSIFYFIGLSSD